MAAPPDLSKPGLVMVGVTNINGNTLEVQSRRGAAVKVETDAQTRFRILGTPKATIADIKIGDVIIARGKRTGDVFGWIKTEKDLQAANAFTKDKDWAFYHGSLSSFAAARAG